MVLIVVADGMGGYQGGEEAAALTTRTVATQLSGVVMAAYGGRTMDLNEVTFALEQSIHEANAAVFELAADDPRYKDMGATAAIVVVWDRQVLFAHVGDCRVYLHRAGKLQRLTEDHTIVARMVALGQLLPEDAEQHELRNEVTEAIGKRAVVRPSLGRRELRAGDFVIAASDGLAAHVNHGTIEQILNDPNLQSQHLANRFVNLADEGGGTDNCTVVVAHFD